MGNTLKEVEAKIKAIENGTGTSGKNQSLELMSKSLNQCFWINMGTTDSIDNSIFSKKENLLYAFTNKQLS